MCDCSGEIVPALEQDFKSTLSQQQTLEQWAAWLEGVVSLFMIGMVVSNHMLYDFIELVPIKHKFN